MNKDPRYIWELARRLNREILDAGTFATIAAYADSFEAQPPDLDLQTHFQAFEKDFLDFEAAKQKRSEQSHLRVLDCMTTPVRCIGEKMSVQALCARLTRQMVSGFPVVDKDDRLVGVVTRSDVVRCMATPLERSEATVEDLMTQYVVTTKPEACLLEALHLMLNFRLHRAVVVDEMQRPIGIITSFDAARALQGVLNDGREQVPLETVQTAKAS